MNITSERDDPFLDERESLLTRIAGFDEAMADVRLTQSVRSLMTVPLTIRQLKVLALVLAANGSATGQRLASSLDVSLATISGIIDRLAEHGMVVRQGSETDHRISHVVATPAGAQIVRDVTASSNEIREDVLRQLDIGDLRALVQGMEALRVALTGDANVERSADGSV